ncbi:MAG: alpha/beta fold hydrolase, partial [Pseudonocardiaceae bacterium]
MNCRVMIAASMLGALGFASRAYRVVSEARDARDHPPPGELVDIGGRRVHLCRAGEGTPSVIIVPCLGGSGSEWWDVQRRLAEYTSVYTYDRAGLGWSDPGPWPRTYPRMADELRRLLTAAKIPPPHLLIGHSTGGIIVRQYALHHPQGLAGLVLVDSSHEDQIRRIVSYKETRHERINLWRRGLRCRFKPLGLIRAAQDLGFRERPTKSTEIIGQSSRCQRADAQELINQALTVPGRPPQLGNLALMVITAGPLRREGWYSAWREMQNELPGLSTQSTHVVMEHVGHHINVEAPDSLV